MIHITNLPTQFRAVVIADNSQFLNGSETVKTKNSAFKNALALGKAAHKFHKGIFKGVYVQDDTLKTPMTIYLHPDGKQRVKCPEKKTERKYQAK